MAIHPKDIFKAFEVIDTKSTSDDEIDRLRAELERVTRELNEAVECVEFQTHDREAAESAWRDRYGAAIARAEKAEADAAKWQREAQRWRDLASKQQNADREK